MRRMLAVMVLLSCTSWGLAQEVRVVPREILDQIADDEPHPLPRFMTLGERQLPLAEPSLRLLPPSGAIYTSAEYELNEGLLIRWGSYNALLTGLTVGVTTGDPEAMVYIVVSGSSQQSSASATLTSTGADMDQVSFITYVSDSVWIRDYGPRFIFEDGSRAMVDHTYNRPRPLDNLFTDHLSVLWSEPQYDLPLVHGGGNFHLFANGDAFMSDLVLLENSSMSEQDVIDYYRDYLNVDLTIYPGFPWNVDGTKHIDMWMMPLGDDKIIIGQYPGTVSYPPKQITDDATADLEARGYTVYRTPGWNSGSGGVNGTHYTYTNSVILNDLVFIPSFGGSYTDEDEQARQVFEAALPNHQVVPLDASDIIHAAGAMHCVVMHVPGYSTTLRVTPGWGLSSSGPVGGPFTPQSITYTLENTSEGWVDYSVTDSADWLSVTGGSGSIAPLASEQVTLSINSTAEVLGVGLYTEAVQFTNLSDHDGDTVRQVELVVGEQTAALGFNMNADPGWSMSGEWQFGAPLGGGGSEHGYPDPLAGATGDQVCGVNLGGDYATTPGGPYYLTTPALDCSNLMLTSLRFRRWLNSDYPPYVTVTVEVSNDGADWMTIWQNGSSEITENAWSEQVYDISAVADQSPSVYVRWGYQVGSSAWAYSGWNIDDVEIWGLQLGQCPADLDGNTAVDAADLALLLGSWGFCLACDADLDASGVVDAGDLALLLGGWGPC